VETEESMSEYDPRLLFMPIATAIQPPSGIIEHIKDCWWLCHPEKGLVWYCNEKRKSFEISSPQCNSNKSAIIYFGKPYTWATILLLPSVFRRVNPRDYL
jgi:hypothetical protein